MEANGDNACAGDNDDSGATTVIGDDGDGDGDGDEIEDG